MNLLDLPHNIILEIFKLVSPQDIDSLQRVCQILGKFIDLNRNRFQSRQLLHLDLDRRRIRAWHNVSWCDRIPFNSFDYISKFFRNVNSLVLTVNKLDEEICEFLSKHAKKHNFRFDQLRLFHSFTASHASIASLLESARCRTLNFEAVQSNLKAENLAYEGYRNLHSISFEMDDSLTQKDFPAIFSLENCVNVIFHGCDNINESFVQSIFQKFMDGSKQIHAIRITTNQNIDFDRILANFPMLNLIHSSTWKMENSRYDTAVVTVRRNAFHFFMAFEVNEHRIENILHKVPIIE